MSKRPDSLATSEQSKERNAAMIMHGSFIVENPTIAPNWRRWSARLVFELRLSVSWTWVLPALGAALVLLGMIASKTPASQHPVVLREALEVGLPIIGVFLVVPLLEAEWLQGTLTQLALRTPLVRVLLVRLLFVIAYLILVTVAITLLSVLSTEHAPSIVAWSAETVVTALAPTLLLSSLALLISHATVNAQAGYLTAVALWLGNVIAALALPVTSDLRSFLLFGWSFPPTPDHIGWLVGKAVLVATAAVLFLPQALLLRCEARLIRHSWE